MTNDNIEHPAVINTVTKSKHPGRVAQGHKLAALMKLRKQELLQNKNPELSEELKPELHLVQDTELLSPSVQYGVLAVMLFAIGGYVYYTRKQALVEPTPEKTPQMKKRKIYLE